VLEIQPKKVAEVLVALESVLSGSMPLSAVAITAWPGARAERAPATSVSRNVPPSPYTPPARVITRALVAVKVERAH
jgi:hypothetical protein